MTLRTLDNRDKDAFSLVEVMVAAILVAIFFASLFQLNAMCLRLIDNSKESFAALQSVQDRLETLRNRSFDDLNKTDCSACVPPPCPNPVPTPEGCPTCVTIPCVEVLMATAANPAPIAQRFTEVVTISKYPPTANGVTQFTRAPNGTVTTNVKCTDCPTDLAKIDVAVSWTTIGRRTRTEQTSCIVAKGSKK